MNKKSSVTSVVHYTSLETLYSIIQNLTFDENDRNPMITLHLGYLGMANDSVELEFVLNKFFNIENEKNLIKILDYEKWKEYNKNSYPCAFSLMKSKKEDLQKGSLPLWHRYGNMAKGVSIKFKHSNLVKYCKAHGLQFKNVGYYSQKQLNQHLMEHPELYKDWDSLLETAVFSKPQVWCHEDEWRILKIADLNDIKVKVKDGSGYLYTEIRLPLEAITEVMFGPLVEFDTQKMVLQTMLNQIKMRHNVKDIKLSITQSKIKIR